MAFLHCGMVAKGLAKLPLLPSLPLLETKNSFPLERTVKGMPLEAAPFTVTTKLPAPAAHPEPNWTTIFWYQKSEAPHPEYEPEGPTTRKQFCPFQVTVELPWEAPKKFP